MNMWKSLVAVTLMLGLLNGCTVLFDHEPYIVEEYEVSDPNYVNAYVHIPYSVRELIADCVDGYSMPDEDMYGPEIYPRVGPRDAANLPSYICADFNGDGYSDYAYMFSKVKWSNGSWFLKTKMVVVVSTYYGYALASDYTLGTVTGERNVAIEEYWGIRLLEPGTHTITYYNNRGGYEKASFCLENYGIYLGSLEEEERTVFYVNGTVLHEFAFDMGAVAKRKAVSNEDRANRIIPVAK